MFRHMVSANQNEGAVRISIRDHKYCKIVISPSNQHAETIIQVRHIKFGQIQFYLGLNKHNYG